MKLISFGVLPLLLLLSATVASSQGVQTGTLRGGVTDTQYLAVPGVTVTITSPAMQLPRVTVTDDEGAFVFPLLPAGEYRAQFQLSGFESSARSVRVPLGGSAEQHVMLRPAGVVESVDVVAVAPPLANASVEFNIRQDEVEALPTSRTLQGITTLAPGVNENAPNGGQVSIHGAFGFDNSFMLNGVDINDNLFGSPQSLFIEDAIEETQVLSSGISAEFGRFTGGVVNAITKSGGNVFSGSFRLNLTNPAWTNETPFEQENGVEHTSEVNDTYEATFGGPITQDRVWFFFAGRLANQSTSETFSQTGIAYAERDEAWRGEAKGTVSPAQGQTLQVGYLNNSREIQNSPTFDFSIDPRTLVTQKVPNWYAFGNYRGVLSSRLLAEGQVSERKYKFEGVGGTSRDIIDSPFITLTQELAHYNAPYFDATDPEERNNRQVTGSVTYYAEGAGRHEVKAGAEWFRSQNTGGNSQSSTDYVFDADYLTDSAGSPVYDAEGRLIPVFVPFGTTTPGGNPVSSSLIENWLAVRGAALNVDTTSLFVQDRWAISPRLTANVGFRYERVRSEATGGIIGVDTDTFVPRLGLTYDANSDGTFVLGTTYGHYAGRYNEAQISGNTNVGNPNRTLGIYIGPPGQGLDFTAGLDPDNYFVVQGVFPTANVLFDDGLSSPVVREFTASAGVAPRAGAYAEVTYVWRKTTNFIEDFVDLSNGTTDVVVDGVPFGEFTNIVYRNSNLPQRRYQAAVFQGRVRARENWILHGAWTLQLENDGNYVGEAVNQPATSSLLGDFPEAFSTERHFPIGRLPNFQRHRGRIWTIYTIGMERFGDMSLSGLWRIESGTPYSFVATGVDLTPTQAALLAAYPDAPVSQNIYFGERGSETFPSHALIDVSVNYAIPLFRSVQPWLKVDVFNLFDNDKLIGFNTTVRPDDNSPLDELELPTGFIRSDLFGESTGPGNYPASLGVRGGRTFRIAAGFRF